MAYCLQCNTEYKAEVKLCTDCGAELAEAPEHASNEPFVEIFGTDNREDIVTARQVLAEAEIEHFVRDLEDPAFPTQHAQRLAVSSSQYQLAHNLIHEAMEDGAISKSGTLLA